jgi:Ca2+-binding EF-hand superfamily protein
VNDKTEQITEKNIFAVLQKLGLRTSRNHAREFFKTLDPLGIGSVSYVDFEIWLMDE